MSPGRAIGRVLPCQRRNIGGSHTTFVWFRGPKRPDRPRPQRGVPNPATTKPGLGKVVGLACPLGASAGASPKHLPVRDVSTDRRLVRGLFSAPTELSRTGVKVDASLMRRVRLGFGQWKADLKAVGKRAGMWLTPAGMMAGTEG